MIKRIKNHILTIPQKIELLILYGALMFLLGIGSNYYYSYNKNLIANFDEINDFEKVVELASDTSKISNHVTKVYGDKTKVQGAKTENKITLEKIAKDNLPLNSSKSEEKTNNVTVSENQSQTVSQTIVVKEGENFTKIMKKLGLDRKDTFVLGNKIDKVFPLKNLKAGQKIDVVFTEKDDNLLFSKLIIDFPLFTVSAVKIDKMDKKEDFVTTLTKKELNVQYVYKSGVIEENLYLFAKKQNIPTELIPSLIDIFSFDIDFQRDIKRGTPAEILFEELVDDNKKFVSFGNILYASIKINSKPLKIYHFKYNSGFGNDDLEYFKHDGSSIKRTLLKTPIDGAIISSHFGKRKHPILGYTKKHKGIDFAAKKGTPLFAAGDGVIIKIGRNGGYGNYIRIRHNSEYDTAYAHLSKFAKNLKKGRKVKQGQIIAYVGSTGASTGPHLHFEIIKHNIQVNPLKVKTPKEKKLKGNNLIKFNEKIDKINKILTNISKNG